MREYRVKESFLDRMYGEYQAHKASVLCLPNVEIYNRSGEVNAVEELYGIMTEKAESLPEEVLAALLQHRELLYGLYESWHQKDGYGYGEMERHAEHEIWRTVQGMEEVLLLPADDTDDSAGLRKMIKEVNDAEVIPEEILSYSLYYYDREIDEIRIA